MAAVYSILAILAIFGIFALAAVRVGAKSEKRQRDVMDNDKKAG